MQPHGSNGQATDAPPTNKEAELGLLRSLLAIPEAMDRPEVASVRPADFFDPSFKTIYRHLADGWREGCTPSAATARMVAAGEFTDEVRAALMEVLRESVSGNDAVYFAELVTEESQRRRLWLLHRELGQEIESRQSVRDLRQLVDYYLDAAESRAAGRFQKITAADLDATSDDVPYIVPNVLAEGQPCAMVGGSKMLKTSIICDLVLSSCWPDSHLLGFFPVAKQLRAWLMSGESGDQVIKETCRRIARAAGRDFKATDGFHYSATLPQLSSPADIAELGREIKADGITLLVIDPLYLAAGDTGGREGSVFAMGPMLRRVSEVCHKHNCTPIIVHHATQAKAKSKDFSPPTLNDASWAGIEQFARQWILLGRRQAYLDGTGEHRLWLCTGGSAGHGGIYHLDIDEGTRQTPGGRFWDTKVTPANEAQSIDREQRAAAEVDRARRLLDEHAQKITDALKPYPAGETRTYLRKATKLNEANFGQAILRLLTSDQVEHCEVKKHTSMHDGYRLKNLPGHAPSNGQIDRA